MKQKQLLFRLTEKDFKFTPTKGRGKGGQKKNKTMSAMICSHSGSGAEGYAEDSRDQRQNKKLAFKRLTETPEFKSWLQLKIDAACDKVEIEEPNDQGTIIRRKVKHEEI